MRQDVAAYVRQCLVCQQCKVEQRPPAGLMGRRTIEKPWQVVAADVMGPFVRSRKGFEYVLIFQDLFSRWVECVPLRKVSGANVLTALTERIFLRFGTPEVFLSDNGTEFKNKVVDERLQELGVHHSTVPPYHPQANPVERVNRTVKQMIVANIEDSHDKWDEHLGELIFAYNTAKHSSTGVSPAFLNYGRNPLPPATIFQEQLNAATEAVEEEAVDEWEKRMTNLEGLRAHAAENAERAQQRQARYYDAHRREVSYAVGDLVWKENKVLSSAAQGVTAKLAPRYRGPYEVTAILGSNTYELTDEEGSVTKPVHVQQMKPYVAPIDEEERDEEPQPPRDNDGEISERNQTSNACEVESQAETNKRACVAKRKRGRPRKTVHLVRRPLVAKPTSNASPATSAEAVAKRRPGRPRGSKSKDASSKDTNATSRQARSTRANLANPTNIASLSFQIDPVKMAEGQKSKPEGVRWVQELSQRELEDLADAISRRFDEAILEEARETEADAGPATGDDLWRASEARVRAEEAREGAKTISRPEDPVDPWRASTSTLNDNEAAGGRDEPEIGASNLATVDSHWMDLVERYYSSLSAVEEAHAQLRAAQEAVRVFRKEQGPHGAELAEGVAADYFSQRADLQAYEAAVQRYLSERKKKEEEARQRRDEERRRAEKAEKEATEARRRELEHARRMLKLQQEKADKAKEEADRATAHRRAAIGRAETARRNLDQVRREVREREEEERRLAENPEACRCMRCGRPRTVTRQCPECKQKVLRSLKLDK